MELIKNNFVGNKKDNLILSSTVNMPLTSLGFHHFIHRTKNSMSITNNLQTKNKFFGYQI